MVRHIRSLAISITVTVATLVATVGPTSAAGNYPGPIDDLGASPCSGARGPLAGSYIPVSMPSVRAYNQHPGRIDVQQVWERGILYRWVGPGANDYVPAYDGDRLIQTPWTGVRTTDVDDTQFGIRFTNSTPLGILRPAIPGYYRMAYDIRWYAAWDSTTTVTVSGSRLVWGALFDNAGYGPFERSYCEFVEASMDVYFSN